MDSYQAIYDAVRSRIPGVNAHEAIVDAIRSTCDLSHAVARVHEAISIIENEQRRPSVLFRPSIGRDGNKWSALYGENLQEGVCGFGDSPEEAMADFDRAWWAKI